MFLVLKVFCIDCAVATRVRRYGVDEQVSSPKHLSKRTGRLTPIDQLGIYPDPSSFLYMLIRINRKRPDKLLAP
jgi:hypothetical protein